MTNPGDVGKTNTGYGVVATAIAASLERLGHQIVTHGEDVEFYFCQPQFYPERNKYGYSYRIAFLPWESTALKDGWLDKLNQCDEVWTPSPLIAHWFKLAGIVRPIFVYEHGLDPHWQIRKRRRPQDKIRFIHVGSPQPRKGAQLTFDAFRAAFGESPDVELTIKALKHTEVRQYNGQSIIRTVDKVPNMKLFTEIVDYKQLPQFMLRYDVLVYPSYGEGFGLIPLEAAATGMPVVITDTWPPYADHINNNLMVRTLLVESPWEQMHPGAVLKPDFDDLVDKLRYTADNFAGVSAQAYAQTPYIWQKYNWDTLTKEAFDRIENILVST